MRRASSSFILSPVAHAVSRLALFATLGIAVAGPSHAQTLETQNAVPAPPLTLKSTPMLAESVSKAPGDEGSTLVFGDRVSGRPDRQR